MKTLYAGMLALAGVVGLSDRAEAWQGNHCGPWAQTAAFPSVNPPGWYTNTYSFAWQYPWFAYYNFSHSPYANWMQGDGAAGYASFAGARPAYPMWYQASPPPAADPASSPAQPVSPSAR